jgi:hypothetical protein
MSYGVTGLEPSSDIRWWKGNRSSREIAERLARSHVDKEALEVRVAELLEENKMLKLQCTAVTAELAEKRQRLNAEIAAAAGRGKVECVGRERLEKDDLERKIQALQMELARERQRAAKQIQEMKDKTAGCICGEIRIEHVRHEPRIPSAGAPERWIIRNSR